MTNTPDLTALNDFIADEKYRFIEKLKANILKIDSELNVKLDYSVSETDSSVIVSGVGDYSYFVSKWFPSKINSNVRMLFNSQSNPYLNENTVKSVVSISLNNDFDIVDVSLKNWVKNADGSYSDSGLHFDHDLKPV